MKDWDIFRYVLFISNSVSTVQIYIESFVFIKGFGFSVKDVDLASFSRSRLLQFMIRFLGLIPT